MLAGQALGADEVRSRHAGCAADARAGAGRRRARRALGSRACWASGRRRWGCKGHGRQVRERAGGDTALQAATRSAQAATGRAKGPDTATVRA